MGQFDYLEKEVIQYDAHSYTLNVSPYGATFETATSESYGEFLYLNPNMPDIMFADDGKYPDSIKMTANFWQMQLNAIMMFVIRFKNI